MAKRSIEDRFNKFHSENPHVYDAIVKLARHAKSRGKTRTSLKRIFELIRWDVDMSVYGDHEFALDNSYTSRYSRLVMANERDLDGMFETRVLKSCAKTEPVSDDSEESADDLLDRLWDECA